LQDILIPKDFLDDAVKFPAFTVKVYLYLKCLADITKETTKCNDDNIWIHIGYDTIAEKIGVSKPSIRQSILMLAEHGWINGFRRGYRSDGGNRSNQYRIPLVKTYNEDEYYKMLLVHKDKSKKKAHKS
jgi:hypothetical protein